MGDDCVRALPETHPHMGEGAIRTPVGVDHSAGAGGFGRLAIVTQYFPPEVYPQTLWVAQAMRGSGFDVHVSTSVPNYPTGVVQPGYRANRGCREVIEGFRVTRAPSLPESRSPSVGPDRELPHVRARFSLVREGCAGDCGCRSCLGNSCHCGLARAWRPRCATGRPTSSTCRTSGPTRCSRRSSSPSHWCDELPRRGLNPYLRALYSKAAHVVAITPGMRRTLVERGVPQSRVSVVYNWVDETVMRPERPNGRLARSRGDAGWGLRDGVRGQHGDRARPR